MHRARNSKRPQAAGAKGPSPKAQDDTHFVGHCPVAEHIPETVVLRGVKYPEGSSRRIPVILSESEESSHRTLEM